jgi:hypothetical protein
VATWPSTDALPGLDDHLAEKDYQEQAEPLGEVVRIQRFGRVRRRERGEVAVATGLPHLLAILRQHRARLDADRDRPQHVAERLRRPDREREQQRRDQAGARDPQAEQLREGAVRAVSGREHEPRDGEGWRRTRRPTSTTG